MSRQYLAALAIAAIYKFSWRRPWRIAKPLWAVLMSFLPWPKVSKEVYAMRMEDCKVCPIFYSPLATCGSPLASPLAVINPLGCWCFQPKAARLKFKICWARKHRPKMNIGWRIELLTDSDTPKQAP